MSRTADDLVRYHAKMMIIDGRLLHVYGFNFTLVDLEKSRSFGVISKNKKLIFEANKLFTADFDRLPYSAGYERFVVSPDNARARPAWGVELTSSRSRPWGSHTVPAHAIVLERWWSDASRDVRVTPVSGNRVLPRS